MIKSPDSRWKITKVNAPKNIGVAVGLFYAKIEERNPFSVNAQRQKRLYAQKESTRQARKNYYDLLYQKKLAKKSIKEQRMRITDIEREIREMIDEFNQALREKAAKGQVDRQQLKREEDELDYNIDRKKRRIGEQQYYLDRAVRNLHELEYTIKKMKEIL